MRRVSVRRGLVALTGMMTAGCASMNPPPGGPEDAAPPVVVSVTPDSGAINVTRERVVFTFDEVINDRADRGELDKFIMLSPQDGAPRVSWRRDEVSVRPRRGWRPNTTYAVTLLPGVSDLRSNRTTVSKTIVFSTGPQLATQVIVGRVFDWQDEKVAPSAVVEAVPAGDSGTVYLTSSDSVGAFVLGPLSPGTYAVRAYLDANRNRTIDRSEPQDSSTVLVANLRTGVDLYVIPRDSIPPRITGIALYDSTRFAVDFDRVVDPAQVLAPTNFVVKRADSSVVAVTTVQSRRAFEEQRRRADTAAARQDSIARARPGAVSPAGPPRSARPAPPMSFLLTLAEPPRPGTTYRVVATGVRGLLGQARASDRVFTVPAVNADSAAGAAPRPSGRPPR